MKKAVWCAGVLLFAFAASAQTEEPHFSLKAHEIQRLDAEHLVAKGDVELALGETTIVADEVGIQWGADKQSAVIRPVGNVIVKLSNLK